MTPLHRSRVWICFIAILLCACSRTDPDTQLRQTVAHMAAAIEARRPADLLEHVAQDFTRESSAFGRDELRQVLTGVMLRHPKISVTAVVTEAHVQGPKATAHIRVVATGNDGGLLPQSGQTWHATTHWRYEDKQWMLFNAEWTEGL